MERISNSLLTLFEPVQIHLLGVDRAPVRATVIEMSGGEVHLRLGDSRQHPLQPGLAVRIESLETVLLGEIATNRTAGESGQIVAVVIRHQFTHLTDLGRMQRALAEAADSGSPEAVGRSEPRSAEMPERSRRSASQPQEPLGD